jgi:Ni/Fe-hydrogenase 1 B-type cytochrome subunit
MKEKAQSSTSTAYTDMLSSTASSSMAYRTMRRIFVFQVPTRVFHWVNVLALFALIGTGIIIGNPPAIQTGTEASNNYWFGINRFIHFASAWVFTFNWFFRIFWSFIGGNRWENWRNFIPYKKSQWAEIWEIIKLDVFMVRNVDHLSIGHNSLAGFSYFLLFLLSCIMMITGFGLYSAMSESWFAGLFTWVIPLLGGDMAVRFVHHSLMWLFVIFTFVHIYLVFYHDYIEGRGEISSIGGGWKFIEEDSLDQRDNSENK